MDEDTFKVYCRLIRAAMNSQTLGYSDVAADAGLPTKGHQVGQTLGPILDSISTYEHYHGRPLLSALVVRADTGIPGQGFFAMARRIGKISGAADEVDFWRQEMDQLNKTWG